MLTPLRRIVAPRSRSSSSGVRSVEALSTITTSKRAGRWAQSDWRHSKVSSARLKVTRRTLSSGDSVVGNGKWRSDDRNAASLTALRAAAAALTGSLASAPGNTAGAPGGSKREAGSLYARPRNASASRRASSKDRLRQSTRMERDHPIAGASRFYTGEVS